MLPSKLSKLALKTSSPSRTFFNGSKRIYNGHKVIGYTQKQIYDVISNINEYKNFVPYCTNSEILKTHCINKFEAELGIGFEGFSETYVSIVTCERPTLVKAEAEASDIFKSLKTVWRLIPHNKLSTHCNFYLEFEFSSIIYSHLANTFFNQISELMIDAFEKRCNTLYGPPASF